MSGRKKQRPGARGVTQSTKTRAPEGGRRESKYTTTTIFALAETLYGGGRDDDRT